MAAEQSLTLPQGLHAAAQARAWIAARAPQLPRSTADDALLIASELVTNAVRHGAPDIVLTLDIGSERIRIEVRDGGGELPAIPAQPPELDRPAGRGLLIVSATASDWGVVRTDEQRGKTVWAELQYGLQVPRAETGDP